jgi:cytochrome c553
MRITYALYLFLLSFSAFAQDASKGAALYKQCILCHGEKGEGNLAQKAPMLSGQYDWYIIKQLEDTKAGRRKNPVMMSYVSKLSADDIKELAAYISKL